MQSKKNTETVDIVQYATKHYRDSEECHIKVTEPVKL